MCPQGLEHPCHPICLSDKALFSPPPETSTPSPVTSLGPWSSNSGPTPEMTPQGSQVWLTASQMGEGLVNMPIPGPSPDPRTGTPRGGAGPGDPYLTPSLSESHALQHLGTTV